METPLFDRIEGSLQEFRPKNTREFVALQIARRFNDLDSLARYLNVSREFPKNVLLEAARLAALRHTLNRAALPQLFFEVLDEFRKADGV
jgi:hypothetical protein